MVLHGDDAMRRASAARRIGILGVVLICVLLTRTSASAQTSRPHKSPVTAVDARTGKQLPVNPLLRHGSRVILTVPGFARRTRVVVALVGARRLAVVPADRHGVVSYPFTVPQSLSSGRHELIFSGPASVTMYRPGPPNRSQPKRDRQALAVTVPYDPPWTFRLGVRPAGGTEHRGTQGHAVGPLPGTGINLVPVLMIGLLFIIAGGIIEMPVRRVRRVRR